MGNCATIGTFETEGGHSSSDPNSVDLVWSNQSSTYEYDKHSQVCYAIGQHRMDSLLSSLSNVKNYNITGWWEAEKTKTFCVVWYSGYCCMGIYTYVWARNLIETTIKERAHQIRAKAHEWSSRMATEGVMLSVDATPLGSKINVRLVQQVQAPIMQAQPMQAYQPVAPVEYAKPAEEVYPEEPIEEHYPEAPQEPEESPEPEEVNEENPSGMHDPPAPMYDY